VLQAKERASIFYSSDVLCLGLTFESFKELGVRQQACSFVAFSMPEVAQQV
jgi:hypothetical protein